jgi:uncharacterized protein (TIGR00255 family)
MTGFARAEAACGPHAWTWEGRSVNSRSLDLRVRLPAGFDRLEPTVRAEAGWRFKRGSVTVNLSMARGETTTRLRVNRDLLDQVLAISRELAQAGAAPPRLDALLAVRGVIEPVEQEQQADAGEVDAALLASLGTMLDDLALARAEEGARLAAVLDDHLDRIAALARAAGAAAAAQPEALRARLRQLVAELLDAAPALPEERLAQEAALLVGKADVREEIDRLGAHIDQARTLLSGGGAIGRRLDFLCQELNREANTLCSKAGDVELTRIGLDLKATIEQFREQVQNIE